MRFTAFGPSVNGNKSNAKKNPDFAQIETQREQYIIDL